MKLIKQMNKWNLKKKITFFLTLMMLVTSVVIMMLSTISAVYYMTKQAKEMARSQLSTIVSGYDDTLKQYQELAIAMVIEPNVQRYCKNSSDMGKEYELASGSVYSYLTNMLNVRNNLNFAVVEKESSHRYVYKGNSSVINAKFDLAYQKDYKDSLSVKEGSSVRISFGNRYFRDGKYTLTLYHPVYSTDIINEKLGMLVLNLDDSLAAQLHEEGLKQMNSELFLMDCNGKIVSISNRERIGERVAYADQIQDGSGSFQKNGFLINYQKVGNWNYYLIHEISVFELYKDSIRVMLLLLAVSLAMTLFSIVILRKMINSFYEPLNRVVNAMDDVAEGKLDERIEMRSMDADSRKLAEGFNDMMDRIDALMEQVKLEQHQIEQISFNALYAQIKPHFLYNTLESIHWQAVADGNKEISTMVKAMAQYYRICLSRGKELIPLGQELEHIRSYLVIQNMRYDNIIVLEDQIAKDYYQVQIPKMTLQPLVENAIYHGIRIKEGGKGKVILSLQRKGEAVCIFLADSGSGMPAEKIDEMNQSISQYDETFGYGVRNVNKRIELMFGAEYGLHYYQNEHGGVTVKIRLPFEIKEENRGNIRDV